MKLENVIVERPYKKVYRCEEGIAKVFEPTHPKEDVFNEALNQARVEATGLNIPKVKSVNDIDGKWALVIEYKEGKTLEELMTEHPELLDQQEYHGKSELVFQAQTYIKEHLKEGTTLASLAEYLHVSKSYLSTLFKQEAGMTVMEYITCARMKEAKRLLLHTDMRVCEIYEEIGYQSDKYFIAVFKSIEGITPLAFRKKYQMNRMD